MAAQSRRLNGTQLYMVQHQRSLLALLRQEHIVETAKRLPLPGQGSGVVDRRLCNEAYNFVLLMQPYVAKSNNYHTGGLPSFKYQADNPHRHGPIFDLVN